MTNFKKVLSILQSSLDEELVQKDLILEFANMDPEEHKFGVDVNLHIYQPGQVKLSHGPRIKIFKNKPGPDFSISLEDTPRVIGNWKLVVKKNELNILLNQSLDKLSGGQKRLLYLIREILALKISPREQQKILFLDEPFNDIDLKNLSFIKRMINDVRKEIPSLIIIMCTHLQLVDGLNRVLKLTRNASIVSIEEIINAQEKHEAIRNRYDHQNE
jgi:ABC-type phosphate transport system ATPase subunit